MSLAGWEVGRNNGVAWLVIFVSLRQLGFLLFFSIGFPLQRHG